MRYPINTIGPIRITSKFGWRFISGKMDFHPGIDIGVDKELLDYNLYPIANDGIIEEKGYDQWRGNYVIIKFGQHTIRYCHLKNMCPLAEGVIVNEDTIVGVMGSTGNSTGIHLHMEIHKCGYPEIHDRWPNREYKHAIDPEKFYLQYMNPATGNLKANIQAVLDNY